MLLERDVENPMVLPRISYEPHDEDYDFDDYGYGFDDYGKAEEYDWIPDSAEALDRLIESWR